MKAFLAAALLSAAAFAGAADFDRLVARAAALERDEDYDGAVKTLRAALAQRPGEHATRVELARDELRLGRLKAAKADFAKARSVDPKGADAYILEGYADAEAGRNAEAERTFRALVAADPSSFVGYHHLASFLADSGRYAEAEDYIRQALDRLRADPRASPGDLLHALYYQAQILDGLGRREEALAVCEEGVAKSSDPPQFRSLLLGQIGKLSLEQGRPAAAEAAFRQEVDACRGAPSCPLSRRVNGLADLAAILAPRGDRAGVARAADEALSLEGSIGRTLEFSSHEVTAYMRLARQLERVSDDGRAEKAYLAALREPPTSFAQQSLERARQALAVLRRRRSTRRP